MGGTVETIAQTDVTEHVEAIDEDNDSGPPTDRNELRRYAAALLINEEPKSHAAAELVDLETETVRLLADAADHVLSPVGIRLARTLASGNYEIEAEYAAVYDEPLPAD